MLAHRRVIIHTVDQVIHTFALMMLIEKTFPSGDRLVYPVGAIFALLSLTALFAPGALA